jgi:hypothetical protein
MQMSVPKWFVVAKNEYRITTSRIRAIRPIFPILVIILLAVLVLYVAPKMVSFFLDDFSAFIVSIAAVAMVEIILFMFFIWFLLIPITNTLKEVDTDELEIFLSAPIKPSDVLLGKFLGVMPFYAIGITILTGFFIAVLQPLGLDIFQIIIIIFIFIFILSSGIWIGTVIAAILKTKLGRTARGKDIGKGLSLLIALPIIAIMYALIGGGILEALADPTTSGTVRMVLGLFPSSWGAEIIVGFAVHPADIGSIWFDTTLRFVGIIAFFVISLWVGTKAANRAYSIEQTSFSGSKAKPDGAFYNSVRTIGGGGSFATLLVTMFKEYTRRLENLSYLGYIVGLFVLINIFLSDHNDPMGGLMTSMFILPMLAGLAASDITLRGKETLFIYRKAPNGEIRFIKSMLIKGWLVVIPITAIIISITMAMIPNISILAFLANLGFTIQIIASQVAFAIGIFLLLPAPAGKPSEKNVTTWMGVMIVMFISMFIFVLSLVVFEGESGLILFYTPFSWFIGLVMLYVGYRRLSGIE